jgi:hypothetical protein
VVFAAPAPTSRQRRPRVSIVAAKHPHTAHHDLPNIRLWIWNGELVTRRAGIGIGREGRAKVEMPGTHTVSGNRAGAAAMASGCGGKAREWARRAARKKP